MTTVTLSEQIMNPSHERVKIRSGFPASVVNCSFILNPGPFFPEPRDR